MLTVPVSRYRIRLILMLGVSALAVMHLLGLYSIYVLHRSNLYGLIGRFHLDLEANIPVWYASLLLLACATVVGVIAVKERADRDPFAGHWMGLALLLLYLSADETAQLHELFTRPMREFTGDAGGWLPFGWVLPGALLAVVVGLAYLRFLMHVPSPTQRGLLLSGALFLGAAIVLETIGGWYLAHRDDDIGYELVVTLEEVLEMLGVIVALDTALAYLASQSPTVQLALVVTEAPAKRG